MKERKQFLETGRIVGTHGIKGELKVEVWSDSAESLKSMPHLYFDEGKTELEITSRRVHKKMLLITLAQVTTMSEADLLRGKKVYLNRDDVKLAEGQEFLEDIMGLEVRDGNTGVVYGKITDIIHTGANDVYEIKGGKTYLFPAVKPMIKAINIDEGVMEVLPIPGIFDDDVDNIIENAGEASHES